MTDFAKTLGKLLDPAAKKRGFAQHELLTRWASIVPEYRQWAQPIKLSRGVLTIAVTSSSAAHNMGMMSASLIQKINQFFGYNAVSRLKFVNKALNISAKTRTLKTIVPDEGANVRAAARCANVKDGSLKEALTRLGALVEMEQMNEFKKKVS